MELMNKINEGKLKEFEEGDNSKSVSELIEEIKALKESLDKKNSELDMITEEKLKTQFKVSELETALSKEELHKLELCKEIEVLKKHNSELEEKFRKEKIEGNAHIGLSKIDFLTQSNQFGMSKLSIGGRSMAGSMRPSRLRSKLPEVPEDESMYVESQIALDGTENDDQDNELDKFSQIPLQEGAIWSIMPTLFDQA